MRVKLLGLSFFILVIYLMFPSNFIFSDVNSKKKLFSPKIQLSKGLKTNSFHLKSNNNQKNISKMELEKKDQKKVSVFKRVKNFLAKRREEKLQKKQEEEKKAKLLVNRVFKDIKTQKKVLLEKEKQESVDVDVQYRQLKEEAEEIDKSLMEVELINQQIRFLHQKKIEQQVLESREKTKIDTLQSLKEAMAISEELARLKKQDEFIANKVALEEEKYQKKELKVESKKLKENLKSVNLLKEENKFARALLLNKDNQSLSEDLTKNKAIISKVDIKKDKINTNDSFIKDEKTNFYSDEAEDLLAMRSRDEKLTADLAINFEEQIKQDFVELEKSLKWAEDTKKNLRNKQSSNIRREQKLLARTMLQKDQELNKENKQSEKIERRKKEETSGKWAYLYKLPYWKFAARFCEKKDLIGVSGSYQFANQAYSSSGSSKNISKLVFGEDTIYVKDILLVSKLLQEDKVQKLGGGDPSGYYLYYLADEEIAFDGSMNEWKISFDYMRRLNNDISIGFQIPIVNVSHKLKWLDKLSDASREKIELEDANGRNNFPARYGKCFKNFIEEVLDLEGINLNEKNSEFGIGNVSAFINFNLKSRHVERLVVGLNVEFPTSRDRDIHELWQAKLGGEFVELNPYLGLLYSISTQFNPHIFMGVNYSCSRDVARRVPRVRKYDGSLAGAIQLSDYQIPESLLGIVLANQVETKPSGTKSIPFDDVDTTFREFATESTRVRISPGAAFNLRLGNIFESFLSRHSTLDIFYDFYAKGRDFIGGNLDVCKWNPSILKDNTFKISHKLGLNLSWQFDEMIRGDLAGLYCFAGRNFEQTWQINADVRVEF